MATANVNMRELKIGGKQAEGTILASERVETNEEREVKTKQWHKKGEWDCSWMWEEGSFSPLAVRGGLVVGRGFLQPIHMIHSIPHHLPPPSPPVGKSGSLLASINANERTGENERTSDPAIQRAGSGSGRVGEIEKSESDRGRRLGRRRRKRVKRRRRREELGPSAVCVPPPPPPPPQPSADRLLGNPSTALFIA